MPYIYCISILTLLYACVACVTNCMSHIAFVCQYQIRIAILNSLAIYLLFGFNEKLYGVLCKYPTVACYFCVAGKETAALASNNVTDFHSNGIQASSKPIPKKSNKEMKQLEIYVNSNETSRDHDSSI